MKNNRIKGVICIIISAFCFALMNLLIRLSGDLPTFQKAFFRNFVAVIAAAVIIFREGGGIKWQKGNLPYLLLRSIFGTMGVLCNFYAVDHLVLSDASMLNKLSPFFAIIFSMLILKEKVNLFQAMSVVIAFIGSLFIIKPTGISMNVASLMGMLGGMGAGMAYTFVRKLSMRGERGSVIVFFFSGFSCLVIMPFMVMSYTPMTAVQVLTLIGTGLAAAGGQFSITAAYSYAPAKEISVFDYSQIVFAALLGFFVLNQVPDIYSVIGYIIICSVSVAMFFRNKRMA